MWSLSVMDHPENKEDRRLGHDRREFLPRRCILEKRSGQDRRIGLDRQIGKEDLVDISEPKKKTDEFAEFRRIAKDLIRGICICLLLWWAIIISIDSIWPKVGLIGMHNGGRKILASNGSELIRQPPSEVLTE